MAIFNWEKKDGLQRGTVGDECMHCRRNRNPEDVYEPKYLDGEMVYKLRINGNDYCLCLDCFKKTLGDDYILLPTKIPVDAQILPEEEEKVEEKKAAAKKSSKKKEGEE